MVRSTSLRFGSLVKHSVERLRERFIPYLGILFLGALMIIAANMVLYLLFQTSLMMLGVVIAVVVNVYLSAWIYLSLIQVLIKGKKITVSEGLTTSHHSLNGFLIYIILFFLFMLFLTPLDLIVSKFILVPVVSMLWGFWSSFAVFVYIDKHEHGLSNLWISRKRINQSFWPVLKNLLLFYLVFLYLPIVLSFFMLVALVFVNFTDILNFNLTSPSFVVLVVYLIILSLYWIFILTPLQVSFNFELYKKTHEVKRAVAPRVWIAAGLLGIVLAIAIGLINPTKIYNERYLEDLQIIPKLYNNSIGN